MLFRSYIVLTMNWPWIYGLGVIPMDHDWNNPPFNLSESISIKDIEESFEDPFAVRLLPDSPRFSAQARQDTIAVGRPCLSTPSPTRTTP